MQQTIGILGMGSFGSFLAGMLRHQTDNRIIAFDHHAFKSVEGVEISATIEDLVGHADVLVLCVPLSSYDTVLPQIKSHLRPETLLIDICSVKMIPEERVRTELPQHTNVLFTHPLFGPQSVRNNQPDGHSLIVTGFHGALAQKVLTFCQENLRLKVSHMTADEHDKTMAQVHALTFFVAHGLREMNLPDPEFMTPSYSELVDLIELDKRHSKELYETIQNGNPHAKAMRQQFLGVMQGLE